MSTPEFVSYRDWATRGLSISLKDIERVHAGMISSIEYDEHFEDNSYVRHGPRLMVDFTDGRRLMLFRGLESSDFDSAFLFEGIDVLAYARKYTLVALPKDKSYLRPDQYFSKSGVTQSEFSDYLGSVWTYGMEWTETHNEEDKARRRTWSSVNQTLSFIEALKAQEAETIELDPGHLAEAERLAEYLLQHQD